MSPIPMPRGWRGPPLAFQILGLLIGGLVVAQLVTLFLTMLLPPAPPSQYGLDDIAAVLRGEEPNARGGRSLQRMLQSGPPDLSGPGWLVSERSRHELAGLLGAMDEDVSLSFYTPLPFAGAAATRPVVAMADDGPVPAFGQLSPRIGSAPYLILAQAPGGGPPPPPGPIPNGAVPPPRDNFPPGMMPGNAPPGGPPRSGFPGNPGPTMPPGALFNIDPTPPGGGPGGTYIPGDGGAAVPPMLQGQPRPFAPAPGAPPPAGAPVQPAGGLPPAGQTGALPPPGPPGPGPGPVQPVPPAPFTDRAILNPLPFGAGRNSSVSALPAPFRAQVGPPRPVLPALPDRSEAVPGVPDPASPLPSTPAIAGATGTEPAREVRDPGGPPIRVTPPARGLFGLAPAPFVEGDFVAALRLPDGRWSVVQPAPEPFPNAWQKRLLLWFAIAFAVVAPLGWLFARRLVKPLAGFASAAERLGRDPAAAVIALDGPAEIGRAAHAFNLMQNRLRSFVDDRTAMVGAISHDLRTPLTRLRFRIEDVPDNLHEGLLEDVAEMEEMITSVLEYIRDASTPGVRERLDLRTLIEDVVEDAVMIGNDVTVEKAESATVEIDVLGMRRVLDNLLQNAVKYGERARIRLRTDADAAIAEIFDDGPGLPDEELERVFEPFYRTEAARLSDKRGSGLGLAVCRSITRAHGGDVRLLHSSEGFLAQVRVPLTFAAERLLARERLRLA